MKNKMLIIILLGMLLPFILQASSSDVDEGLKSKIDSYLKESQENGFSGAVLVAKKDTIILKNG